MSADRITAVRLWMGAAVFGAIAMLAWVHIAGLIPWELLTGSSWDVYVPTNFIEVSVVTGLPLLGNLLVFGETRRVPLARRLRRLHWVAWASCFVFATLILEAPAAAAVWIAALALLLVATQLTLLTAVYATLALNRSHATA